MPQPPKSVDERHYVGRSSVRRSVDLVVILTFWSLTLKIFSAMSIVMVNISAKFHWDSSVYEICSPWTLKLSWPERKLRGWNVRGFRENCPVGKYLWWNCPDGRMSGRKCPGRNVRGESPDPHARSKSLHCDILVNILTHTDREHLTGYTISSASWAKNKYLSLIHIWRCRRRG